MQGIGAVCMDAISLSLVILVLFIPLLAFFATAHWSERNSECEQQTEPKVPGPPPLLADFIRLQRPRSKSVSRDYAPVLRQNVAVARLMRMEGSL